MNKKSDKITRTIKKWYNTLSEKEKKFYTEEGIKLVVKLSKESK